MWRLTFSTRSSPGFPPFHGTPPARRTGDLDQMKAGLRRLVIGARRRLRLLQSAGLIVR